MSTMAVDQPCVLLPIRTISPLRTYHVMPPASRSWVTRSDTFSTVPTTSPVSMTSPTPYWSSTIMKTPDRKSLTRLCAPKASATPPTLAEASIGPSGMPTSDRTVRAVMPSTTNVVMLLSRAPIVWVRCTCRTFAPRTAWRARPAPGMFARRSARRDVAVATTRLMSRCSTKRARRPTTITVMMSSGVPTSQSPTPAHVRLDRSGIERFTGSSCEGDGLGVGAGVEVKGVTEVRFVKASITGSQQVSVRWSVRWSSGGRQGDVRWSVRLRPGTGRAAGRGRPSRRPRTRGSAAAVALVRHQCARDRVAVLGDGAQQAGRRVRVGGEPGVRGVLELLARERERVEAADDALADGHAALGPRVDEHRVVLLDVGLEQRQVGAPAEAGADGLDHLVGQVVALDGLGPGVGLGLCGGPCGERLGGALLAGGRGVPVELGRDLDVIGRAESREGLDEGPPQLRVDGQLREGLGARQQRPQPRLVGRVGRRARPGLDELELGVTAGLGRLGQRSQRGRQQRGDLGAVLRCRVEARRRRDLTEQDAQQGRVRLARHRLEDEADEVTGRHLAVTGHVPRRTEHERAGQRVLEAAGQRERRRERALVEADLAVSEVVVVEQQQFGLLLADELREIGARPGDVHLVVADPLEHVASRLIASDGIPADADAVRAERRVLLGRGLRDRERAVATVRVDLEDGPKRVDAGRLEPQLAPLGQLAAGGLLELAEQVGECRVAPRVLAEVLAQRGDERLTTDVGDELLEHRRALGIRDAVEVDLDVLEVAHVGGDGVGR